MMFRWTLRIDKAALAGLPELELFPNELQRLNALERLRRQNLWSVRNLGTAMAPAVLSFGLMPVFLDFMRRWPAWISFTVMMAFMFCGVALVFLILTHMTRRQSARFLRVALLDTSVPVCLRCGYYLRGLTSDRCPECGREWDDRVRALIREDAQRDSSGASDGSAP